MGAYIHMNSITSIFTIYSIIIVVVNPESAELKKLIFHPLEVVSRYRDPQLQVAENYSYLFNFRRNICKSSCVNTYFIPNNCDLIG